MTNLYTTKAITLINIGKQVLGAQELHMIDNSGSTAANLEELLDGGYLLSKPVDTDVIKGVWVIEKDGSELTAKIDAQYYEVCEHIDEHPVFNFTEDRNQYQYGCRETEDGTIFFISQ